MNKILFRLCAILCLVGVGALGFQRFACDRPGTEEPGPHLLPTAVVEYLDAFALDTESQERAAMSYRCLQAKRAVVTELLADRLTLLEAAARFRELDAGMPEARDRLLQAYPGVPYQVALCQQVIARARSELEARALEQVESVVARLEAELQAHRECETGLRLP
jgi:hypothetical protein